MAGQGQSQQVMHDIVDKSSVWCTVAVKTETPYGYTFENFFHPFVGELIEQLNKRSLEGFFDSEKHESWKTAFFEQFYTKIAEITPFEKEIDVGTSGPDLVRGIYPIVKIVTRDGVVEVTDDEIRPLSERLIAALQG